GSLAGPGRAGLEPPSSSARWPAGRRPRRRAPRRVLSGSPPSRRHRSPGRAAHVEGARDLARRASGDSPDPSGRPPRLGPSPRGLRGAPARPVPALASALGWPPPDGRWIEAWRQAGDAAREALRGALAAEAAPFEGHAVDALANSLATETTLYAGNSLAIRDLDWFWPAGAPPVRVLANRGAD